MQTFELFIEDDRYTVPTLEFVPVGDAARARQVAAERLFVSMHHQSVEVRFDNERICYLSRSARPESACDAQQV